MKKADAIFIQFTIFSSSLSEIFLFQFNSNKHIWPSICWCAIKNPLILWQCIFKDLRKISQP